MFFFSSKVDLGLLTIRPLFAVAYCFPCIRLIGLLFICMVASKGVGEEVEDSDTFSALISSDFLLLFFWIASLRLFNS